MAALKANTIYRNLIISFILTNNFAAGHFHRRQYDRYDTATWNMQGATSSTESDWANVIRPLMQTTNPNHSIDLIALQESGSVPSASSLLSDEQRAPVRYIDGENEPRPHVSQNQWLIDGDPRGRPAYIYHMHTSAQYNVAIVSTQPADEVIVVESMNAADRPVVGIRIATDYFFSLHAEPTGDSNEAPEIVSRIEFDMGTVLESHPEATWMIMGNYNRDPVSLVNSLARAPHNVHRDIVDTGGMTRRSGGNFDYAVRGTGGGSQAKIVAFIYAENGMYSDHAGVLFISFTSNSSLNQIENY